MADEYDDILDGLFHGCALAAYPRPGREPSRAGLRARPPAAGPTAITKMHWLRRTAGNPPLPLTRPVELNPTIQTPETEAADDSL